jgi:rod shape-determining protein MreC
VLTGTRQRLREATVVVAALGLALLMLRQSARTQGALGSVDRLVLKVVAPAQRAATGVARDVRGVGDRYLFLTGVQANNQHLRDENRRLQAELHQARAAATATARLERLLGMREALAATSLPARIIAVDTSPYFRVARVTLDRGFGQVEAGMPVIAPEGVVGRIVGVAGQTADVQLAVDPRSNIHVVIPRTGGRGLLVGKAGENGYRCLIQYFARTDGVKVGDPVVTTGLGGFPRDLPVGTVARVAVQPGSMFQEVEIAPHVDFARLSEVLVVVAPAPAVEPRDHPAAPAAARGLSFYR